MTLLAACGGERGCGGDAPPPPLPRAPAPPPAPDPLPPLPLPPDASVIPPPPEVDVLTLCVDEINGYRAQKGLPALTRAAELDAYAATAARVDAGARQAHRHFRSAGRGIARAENEIPWWPLATGDPRDVIREGTEAMWAEGPGGGHYENIAGPYTLVGCGVFVNDGRVTVVQAFR